MDKYKIVQIMGFGRDTDAYLNLYGAVLDIRNEKFNSADKISRETLERVLNQLGELKTYLGEVK